MKIFWSLLTTLLIIILFGCTSKESAVEEQPSNDLMDDPNLKKIFEMKQEERLNNFAFDIYKEILRKEDGNMVVSPFSISTAMAMAYGGSGEETKNQMSKTLMFDPDMNVFHKEFNEHSKKIEKLAGDDLELNIANGMWIQHDYPFLQSYIETIQKYYGSVLHEADFKSDQEKIRQEINKWVEERTNHKIQELIEQGILVEDTRMVLVNAIYFLSNWYEEFEKDLTHKRNFHLNDNDKVEVEFMNK